MHSSLRGGTPTSTKTATKSRPGWRNDRAYVVSCLDRFLRETAAQFRLTKQAFSVSVINRIWIVSLGLEVDKKEQMLQGRGSVLNVRLPRLEASC